ncbi:MAG: helix-turn-helix domain-containing protein, partial [Solirubrobacterales bacterium]|nr:helix-turn-helix domain-containing protein [Solirubrobacterales bacterium]MBV9472945.1 helix-turn-helix domain-containing protein [Solirubrobacterales bacterium]
LEPFGLSERVAAIVLVRPNNGRGSSAPLESTLATALREEAAPGLIASTGSLTCALVQGLAESELFALAERVSERLSSALGVPLRVGVGRAVASGEARRSFHEARCALEAVALGATAEPNGAGVLGAQLPGGDANGLATYRDLGSFQLLLSLQEDEALRLFCDSILGPIETSEGQYGGELMRSLEAFIEENGQWERAARRLFCHRHTLRYRIRRVEELTGRNLGNARDRIEFWLALRGRELVR